MSAIALVGGLLYERIAIVGPAASLPEAARAEFLAASRRRWSKVVMITAFVLLATGLYNGGMNMYTFNTTFSRDHAVLNLPRPGYTIFLTIKMVLALIIFFIASVLSGSRPGTAKIRAEAGKWLNISIVLVVVVVGLGDVMRGFHTGPNIDKVQEVLKQSSDAPPFQAGGK
ncbi:MAG: hypothetical protein K8T25_05725 [Planctomycetia bacterium]|nr:hypothetical protein [Planctomycetia bacterium]